MVRKLQYTVPVFNPLGPPSTICYIKQQVLKKGPGFIVISAIHDTPGKFTVTFLKTFRGAVVFKQVFKFH